jgi:hypothetical protein
MTLLSEFTKAIAEQGQPLAAMQALEKLALTKVGAKLFTLTTVEPGTGEAERIYTNMPDAYPVSGRKPADTSDWSRHVLGERRTFVANSIEEIAAVFPDHALIQSLGCESVINIPIEVNGAVVGTMNLLHQAGFYSPDKLAAAEALRLPGALCFLLCAAHSTDLAKEKTHV